METTKETEILSAILPPRLEDAGLEDCALPPDSIREAFLKAASAVKSRVFNDDEDDCVQDPFPEQASDAVVGGLGGGASDALIGGDLGNGSGSCVAEKGGGVLEEGKDKVVVGGGDAADLEGKDCGGDVTEVEGKGCGGDVAEDSEEEEGEGKKPTLVEGFA